MIHDIALLDTAQCNQSAVNLFLSVNAGDPSADIDFSSQTFEDKTKYSGYIQETETWNSTRVQVVEVSTLISSQPYTVTLETPLLFLSSFCTNLESSNASAVALRNYDEYYNLGAVKLSESHRQSWKQLWSEGGIEITGNLRLAQRVNASLYAILSNVRSDWPFGVSPGGIGTNAYNGHVFWDMETWVYPSLLLLQPSIARSLLEYRIQRVPRAIQKSSFYHLSGAWFPWESAFTGVECCPFNGGKNTEGLLEIHINGDISFACMQYLRCQVNPVPFLEEGGKNIIEQVANFWASRVRYNGTFYLIDNVQPPDESAGRVNNSVYTNSIAALSLTNAISVLEMLGEAPPAAWSNIANNLLIPFDTTLQGHPEYEGYNGEMINQADTILMQYPLGIKMSEAVAHNDLSYYQKKTRKNGYFTGDNAYSIAWLALNEYDSGVQQYRRSFSHIRGPFDVWWEKVRGGHSHFITGAGGFLQNFIFGFGGIRILTDTLMIDPVGLPDADGYLFRHVDYKGKTNH
eukprot:CAMPEP_0206182492 /NCGR_PEP_ID=MMETSP0166-20121206/94_1 /ASSEMBLY_ACC=CAM_ASM_000260 /TAXON_ID=95228 /ORGANISM="Vannella robusta, Strain DIVA3 518/3/11/1/6" /LENGTH=516 /DNA_ID=CAMNT_0053597205 /DNA_START=330 /DNA_END=1880 /DNA_ORIENTATION=-